MLAQTFPGKFIVLEGIDGSGKSTQIKKIAAYLEAESKAVVTTEEPTNTPIGTFIRRRLEGEFTLDNTVFQMLYIADRLQHLEDVVLPALREGKIVLCDRYHFSTIAYGEAMGCDEHLLRAYDGKILRPDVAIYIDISPATAMRRITVRNGAHELFEKRDQLKKIHGSYVRQLTAGALQRVDGEPNEDEVFASLKVILGNVV